MSNPNQVAGGHKAAINNDNVPEESKEHSKEVLENLDENQSGGDDNGVVIEKDESSKNENNVIGGYKATLNNPRVGEEAKEHAKEVLKEHGVDV